MADNVKVMNVIINNKRFLRRVYTDLDSFGSTTFLTNSLAYTMVF